MTVEETKNNEEAELKRVIEGGVEAFRARDIDGMMSMYAPELVSFDLVPPLRYVGADAYRKRWEETFSSFQGPIGYEMHDLSITVGDDVAFTHSLNRLSATLTTGQQTDLWLRATVCWRSINGQWLIMHTHVSVPVDVEHGQALLDLSP
jgi:ketosteroid isomerase-like protein